VQYPIPKLAGVKSWNTFVKNARCVNVKVAGGKVLFTPSRNKGPKQYFEPIVDDAVELPVGSSEELIGDALREAFTQCK